MQREQRLAALASRQFGYPLPFRGQVCRVQRPLPCFPSMGLHSRRLPSLGRVSMGSIPRRQRYYEGATTPRSAWPWRSWCSRQRSTPISSFVLRRSAPARLEKPRGPGLFAHSAVLSAGSFVAWANTGSPRFPGGPSHASAKLQDPGRTRAGKPLRQAGAAPAAKKTRAPAFRAISGLATWLQHSLSTLQELCRQAPARLASGWLASLCRAGFDPAEPLQQVSDHFST